MNNYKHIWNLYKKAQWERCWRHNPIKGNSNGAPDTNVTIQGKKILKARYN